MDSAFLVSLVSHADLLAQEGAEPANAFAPTAPGGGLDIVALISQSSGVVLAVLLVLVGFSLISWYIIGYKTYYLRKAQAESIEFLESFWQSKRLDAIYQVSENLRRSPISQVFRAGYVELSKLKSGQEEEGTLVAQLGGLENVDRALRRALTSEIIQLESMVPFLATTGSTAPFIGLFGTVWGIMNAFISIGASESATLATVAPGIAEALIATAIGLVAAIPAVMAYNYFNSRIRVLTAEMESFSNDFLNIVKRHFFK
jgi:biopolymer transport protein TolQ